MSNQTAITKQTDRAPLAFVNDMMKQAGKIANKAAARQTFADHTARKSDNTIRRKIADLALFEAFLNSANIPARDLYNDPQAWRGVSWGIVKAFTAWMLSQGYAIASINGRLSTVRTFAKLAAQAGAITPQESILIASVQGYANKEKKNIDDKRRADGMPTRKGSKKADAVHIPEDIAAKLITQPNTPQGRRDALLMCLFIKHGLRVSEAALLTVKSFDLKTNKLFFYRPKVNISQTITLAKATREAAAEYIKHDAPGSGIIWRKSHKGTAELSGQLSETSATRALTKRVELLGRKAGIVGLSAHDARHYWATFEANNETPIDKLMNAGGWNSPAMPLRYIERAQIANEGTASIKDN